MRDHSSNEEKCENGRILGFIELMFMIDLFGITNVLLLNLSFHARKTVTRPFLALIV